MLVLASDRLKQNHIDMHAYKLCFSYLIDHPVPVHQLQLQEELDRVQTEIGNM